MDPLSADMRPSEKRPSAMITTTPIQQSDQAPSNDRAAVDLTIVVACYHEEPHLLRNIVSLHNLLKLVAIRYEVIFVDDASRDGTRLEIHKCLAFLGHEGVPCQAAYHDQNQGRGAAIRHGMALAKGEIAGFLDIDLEHKPDAIPMLLSRFRHESCDVIVGRRYFDTAEMHPLRLLSHLGYRKLVHSLLSLPVGDTEAGFKFFRMKTCRQAIAMTQDSGWFWDTEIVHHSQAMGLTVVEHPIIFARDPSKKSTVRVFRDSWRMFQALLEYRKRLAKTARPRMDG
jgi:glycosyltransferase involved in cell wall biosynthesis